MIPNFFEQLMVMVNRPYAPAKHLEEIKHWTVKILKLYDNIAILICDIVS